MTRRAFTVIELMTALFLATIVVSGTVTLFFFLSSSEARLNKSFSQRTDITITHTVIMRAMGTLAAGIPLTPDEEDEDLDDESDPDLEDGEDPDADADLSDALGDVQNQELQDQLSALFGDSLSEETIEQVADIAFIPPEAQFEILIDNRNTQDYFSTLELALASSPLPRTRSLLYEEPSDRFGNEIDRDFQESLRGTIRGAFEIIELNPGQRDYALQWVWLDEPDLEPRILLKNIVNIRWSALVPFTDEETGDEQKVWAEVHSAYLLEDFPYACRVEIELADGTFLDWMFETAVTEPEQPT